MTGTDDGVVEHTIRIGARPETVWRYWTDPERICDWWGVSAELDSRPGGTCLVMLGGNAVMRGEFVELIPCQRIVFTLGWEPADGAPPVAPGSTTVTVTLAVARAVIGTSKRRSASLNPQRGEAARIIAGICGKTAPAFGRQAGSIR